MNLSFPSCFSFTALSARARGLVTAAAGISALALGACSQTPVTVDLHSLQASGRVSFVCHANDGSAAGHKLNECPDYDATVTRHLLGLVTQTATNEVAIVDLYAGAVVDVDPTTPGYSFLRVGASPGAIVTTPGGAASFVGVSGFQKNGIFALPSTCLSAPAPDTASRDLTSWSACSLSSAPGEITVLVDPPSKSGAIRGACDGSPQGEPNQSRECPADLTREGGAPGRRKLLVSLPDEHKLVLLDAQSLLDRAPGEFTSCTVEATFALNSAVPATPTEPTLPPDLQIDPSAPGAAACVATQYPPLTSAEQPTPDGFALSGQKLYVGDNTLPLVHVFDVADPCAATEQEPLLPHSYEAPNRIVTTSRVAVSPLTPSGKQYVYAVDRTDAPSSVMVFDISPGSLNRTPVVFPNGPKQPYLPPDRLRFGPNVKDVSFVQRDFPAPDATGVGQYGLACDPYPDSSSPATQYQPSTDYSTGARPLNLRGVFGFVLLSDGHIAIIDVEDFDAPCRRPVSVNTSQFEDFRGCAPDKLAPGESMLPEQGFMNKDTKVPTVTNESTCNIVEPNRPRSEWVSVSNSTVGLRAPTLRSFPQFENPDPAAVLPNSERPQLLAVDFPNPDPNIKTPVIAPVNIGAQVYCSEQTQDAPCNAAQPLPVAPKTSTQNSLVLPLSEPRSYAAEESPVLTYEGALFTPPRKSGFIHVGTGASTAILNDPDANFCAAGLEDSDSILTEAEALQIPTKDGRRAAWAKAHADYVQITGDFPDSDDIYWTDGAGANNRCTRDLCAAEFGDFDNQAELSTMRDLSILAASGDHLVVTPRCQKADGSANDECNPALFLRDIQCCFPAGTAYTVRTSHQWLLSGPSGVGSASHDIAAGADGRCVHTATCEPRKKFFHARAFEVCDGAADADPDGTCKATDPTVTCVASGRVNPGGVGQECIFENLTARFVVYRGARRSTRGMSFSWQTTGGFAPLTMSLNTQLPVPTTLSYLPEVDYLAVIDGASVGLSLFDLNSLGLVAPSPYF